MFLAKSSICWAGPVAQARATRKSVDGWLPSLSCERVLAIHEAGHAVGAAAVGRFVHEVSIVADPEAGSAGRCLISISPEPPERTRGMRLLGDRSHVALLSLALMINGPKPHWPGAVRIAHQARENAKQIVDRNWLLILALASELERNKELDKRAVESLIRGRAIAT